MFPDSSADSPNVFSLDEKFSGIHALNMNEECFYDFNYKWFYFMYT